MQIAFPIYTNTNRYNVRCTYQDGRKKLRTFSQNVITPCNKEFLLFKFAQRTYNNCTPKNEWKNMRSANQQNEKNRLEHVSRVFLYCWRTYLLAFYIAIPSIHINIIIYNIPKTPFNLQQNTITPRQQLCNKKRSISYTLSFDGFICTIFSFICKWIEFAGFSLHHMDVGFVDVFACELHLNNRKWNSDAWFLLLFSCNYWCSAFPSITVTFSFSLFFTWKTHTNTRNNVLEKNSKRNRNAKMLTTTTPSGNWQGNTKQEGTQL